MSRSQRLALASALLTCGLATAALLDIEHHLLLWHARIAATSAIVSGFGAFALIAEGVFWTVSTVTGWWLEHANRGSR